MIGADGRPHLVPIAFVIRGETLYGAVDGKPKRSRRLRAFENARDRSGVSILVDHYGDDRLRLWWVRRDGQARVLDAGKEAEFALRLPIESTSSTGARAPGRSA